MNKQNHTEIITRNSAFCTISQSFYSNSWINQDGFFCINILKKSCMYSFPLPLTVAFTLTFISNLMHISADKKKWLHMGKIEIIVNQS